MFTDEQVPSVQTDFCTFGYDKQKQMGIHFLDTMQKKEHMQVP